MRKAIYIITAICFLTLMVINYVNASIPYADTEEGHIWISLIDLRGTSSEGRPLNIAADIRMAAPPADANQSMHLQHAYIALQDAFTASTKNYTIGDLYMKEIRYRLAKDTANIYNAASGPVARIFQIRISSIQYSPAMEYPAEEKQGSIVLPKEEKSAWPLGFLVVIGLLMPTASIAIGAWFYFRDIRPQDKQHS